jgi:hypothetical protein
VDDVADIAEADMPSSATPPSSGGGSTTTSIAQVKASLHVDVEVDLEELARPVPEQLNGIAQDIIAKVCLLDLFHGCLFLFAHSC